VFVAELDQIVDVTITADSKTPSRQGFGTPLLLSYHTRWVDHYRTYGSLREVAVDFETYDSAYRMASVAFAQNPCPKTVVVGRLPAAPSFTRTLTMTSAVEGEIVSFTIIDPTTGTATDISYTILAAATTTTVATAVELLVEAVTGIASSASTDTITITPVTAGGQIWVYNLVNCTTEETTADAGYDDELTALQLLNDDWYFITTDTCSAANVALIGAWALANKKMYFVSTDSSGELAGTGTIGSALSALSNDRTVVLYAPNSHEFGGVAWAALGAAQTPGSITWAFKTLKGVTSKNLTAAQRAALETDNENHYQSLNSLKSTRPGKVTSGEWIDIVHGIDALEARIKEDVYALFVNSAKVPYTASGLDLVASAILGAMKAFEGTVEVPSLLVEGTSLVIMPEFSTISTADRAARQLTGVRFSATLAGAIHSTTINGTLSV
jgi:hypothetical protein